MNLQTLYTKLKGSGDLAALGEIKEYLARNDAELKDLRLPPELSYEAIMVGAYLQDVAAVGAKKGAGWVQAGERMRHWKALNETSDVAGGYMVPTELNRALLMIEEGRSTFMPWMRKYSMKSDTLEVPTRNTRLSVAWHTESEAISDGEGDFGHVTLTARRLDSYCKVTNELLQDESVGIAAELAAQFAEGAAMKLDDSIINGDGGATYGGFSGIMTAAAGYSEVFGAGSTAFSEVMAWDLVAAKGKVPSYIRRGANDLPPRGFFVLHADILGYLSQEVGGDGAYLISPYGNNGQIGVHGYPVLEHHLCPASGDSGADTAMAAFVVPQVSLILGDRAKAETLVDPYSYSLSNMTNFIFLQRLAIAWGFNAGVCRIMTAA